MNLRPALLVVAALLAACEASPSTSPPSRLRANPALKTAWAESSSPEP